MHEVEKATERQVRVDCIQLAESIFKTVDVPPTGTTEARVEEVIEIAKKLEDYIYGITKEV